MSFNSECEPTIDRHPGRAVFDRGVMRIIPALGAARAEPSLWWGAGKLFVFGGYRCDAILDDGAVFDGTSWTSLPKSHLRARFGATAVWTGQEAIVWGGASSDGARLDDGARFRP